MGKVIYTRTGVTVNVDPPLIRCGNGMLYRHIGSMLLCPDGHAIHGISFDQAVDMVLGKFGGAQNPFWNRM